jgi:hypothetical protein
MEKKAAMMFVITSRVFEKSVPKMTMMAAKAM